VKKPLSVKYLPWFKKEASKIVRMRAEIQGLRIERQAVLQEIEDAKDYNADLEQAIIVLEREMNTRRLELAKRFASYDENFRHDVLMDPTLLQ